MYNYIHKSLQNLKFNGLFIKMFSQGSIPLDPVTSQGKKFRLRIFFTMTPAERTIGVCACVCWCSFRPLTEFIRDSVSFCFPVPFFSLLLCTFLRENTFALHSKVKLERIAMNVGTFKAHFCWVWKVRVKINPPFNPNKIRSEPGIWLVCKCGHCVTQQSVFEC